MLLPLEALGKASVWGRGACVCVVRGEWLIVLLKFALPFAFLVLMYTSLLIA